MFGKNGNFLGGLQQATSYQDIVNTEIALQFFFICCFWDPFKLIISIELTSPIPGPVFTKGLSQGLGLNLRLLS